MVTTTSFSGLQTDLSQIVNLDTADTTNLANLKRWINTAYKDFCARFRWSWLVTKGSFQTTPRYETGTADFTQNSRTVSGGGTAWASTMIGSYINCKDNNDWYKIIAVGSATSLTIDKPYLETTKTSQNYTIWKRYYKLNPDVRDLVDIYFDVFPVKPTRISDRTFRGFVNTDIQGTPTHYAVTEIDKSVTTYNTGTCSGTINTQTITGSGTSWLSNLQPGDKFVVGSYTYYVLSVDSDTSLTTTTNLMAAITASTAYTATRRDVKQVEFNYIPDSPGRNVTYTYLRAVYDMQNDNDLPDVPEQWINMIIHGATWIAYKSLDDQREGMALQEYEKRLADARREDANDGNSPQSWTQECGNDYSTI